MIKNISEKTIVAWQQWGEDSPGEPAILMRKYKDSIEIVQNDNVILISVHEVSDFSKLLLKLNKL